MGKIAGVFYFDSRPISEEDEAWVRSAVGDGNPPPVEIWRGPGLIMGEVPFPYDCGETGTRFESPDGSVCHWDGVLHNRGELENRFGNGLPAPFAVSWLALRLYQAHGASGLEDLIGDWSLAIWDAPARSLLLASDYAGIRPLYYCQGSDSVLWASSLQHLVQRAGTRQLDEEFVAGFLTRGKVAYRTPYRGIHPAPPGQAVRLSAKGVSREVFWNLPFRQETRFQDGRDYEDRMRSLFQEAVGVRLSGNSPVCAELSGGMDSSSVVCMAHQIMAGRGKPVTFSYLFAGSTDEKYIRAVERALDHPGTHLNLEEYPFFTAERAGEAAPGISGPRLAEVAGRMAAIGSGVLLTGQLGDFIMGGTVDDFDQVVGYLEKGRLIAAGKEAFAWSQSMRVPIYSILWRSLRATLSGWTPALDRSAGAGVLSAYAGVDSLAPEFRKRVSLNEIERQQRRRWQEARPSQRRRFRALTEILESRFLQAPEPVQHISFTHPFAHRPLVEYMLAVPPGEVCRPGEPRRLMRRAFAGILPPAILRRKSKTVYTPVYRQTLEPLAAELVRQPGKMRLVELGYIERQSVADRLTRFMQGLDCNEAQLRNLVLLEYWLRKRGGPSEPAHGQSPPAPLTFPGLPPQS